MEKTAEIGEQELAILCAKGDSFAMKELYTRYATRLSALCTRYAGGPEDGMDLMHDAMCKVFDTIGRYQYKGDGSLYAWISRVAIHLALDRFRKEKKWETISLEDGFPDVVDLEPTDIDVLPEDVLIRFISRLSLSKRLVFNMFCIEELSHKQIADQLDITEAASRSTLSKAKKALAAMIRSYLEKRK